MPTPSAVSPRIPHPKRNPPEQSLCLKRFMVPSPSSNVPTPPSVETSSTASNIAANGEDLKAASIWRFPDSFSADKWFDDSNQNTSGKGNVRFIDNDSPFYISSNQSPKGSTKSNRSCSQRAPFGYFTSHLHSSGSSSEGFRSVIDDLTIENRKLRQKLRRYEQLNPSHMQEDKIFEVRVHGLSPLKRRKLEQTLRDFASGVTCSPRTISPGSLALNSAKIVDTLKDSASLLSNSKPVDSTYASLSTSGRTSVPRSQYNTESLSQPSHPTSKDQRVHRYLENISRVLLPKSPAFRTEQATKKLIVERLEQLFVGQVGSSNKPSQFQWPQEVPQSAAIAGKQDIEVTGQRINDEGIREAKIYLDPYELREESVIRTGTLQLPLEGSANVAGVGAGAVGTPNQRPTRPLDLDPSRAQNPAESIEYMKHLGFCFPKREVDSVFEESEGWVYLNLLVNMAQLHTLNVTPDFIRTAISEVSTKFEISKDSQSIRWKGGKGPTRTSCERAGNTSDENTSPSVGMECMCNQPRRKSSESVLGDGSSIADASHFCPRRPSSDVKFDGERYGIYGKLTEYQPDDQLFMYNDDRRCISPHIDQRSSLSTCPVDDPKMVYSKLPVTKRMESLNAINLEEPGLITFYHGARFCTDLSRDFAPPPEGIAYRRATPDVLGVLRKSCMAGISSKSSKRPFSNPIFPLPDCGPTELSSVQDLKGLEPVAGSKSQSLPPNFGNVELPVSGIGGVVPGDNTQIGILRIFHGCRSEYLSVSRRELSPASLPSPSYAFLHFTSSSNGSDAGDEDEEFSNRSDEGNVLGAD